MTTDARSLFIATELYMRSDSFVKSPVRVADGKWEKSDLFYFIEEKTERESLGPPSNWWKNDNDDLVVQRPHINCHYRSKNRQTCHENKWIIVIAQLRAAILRSSNINRSYRALFAIPSVEVNNFKIGFNRYHADLFLNNVIQGQSVSINVWQNSFNYMDQRGIPIQTSLVEIDCDNYFGPM